MSFALLPLLILLGAPPQSAPTKTTTQPAPAHEKTTEETAKAKGTRLGKEGTNAYQRGELEEAARLWTEAYAFKPSAELLFNLGAVYWRLARYVEAAEAYEQFLELAPKTHPAYEEAQENLLYCQREYMRVSRLSAKASAGVLPSAPALELPRQVEERIAEIRRENRVRALWVTGASSAALAGVVASFFLLRPEPPEPLSSHDVGVLP